jgi:glycoprotein endo-alpha-1,2-mannosidase
MPTPGPGRGLPEGPGGERRSVARVAVAVAAFVVLAACGTGGSAELAPVERSAPPALQLGGGPRPLVGAHYYLWYPSNWGHGTLRAQLDPPQQPVLGWYDSADPAVAEAHIAWASAHGIDFFTMDWWPVRHQENQVALPAFLSARNIDDIAYAIFYETWDVAWDGISGYAHLDDEVRGRFVADMARLADEHFDHPSYLRVDGRPVLFLYLTRVLTGDVAAALAEARAVWYERGHDPLVIADEIFWTVAREGDVGRMVPQPQRGRIELFDAIFAYNPYDSGTPGHAGHGASSPFVDDVNGLYERYVDATGGAVPVVPGVLPGYNDRGVRPVVDHYVIPREWAPGAGEGSFLAEMLRRVADRWIDERVPMVLVTSWNEWHEDTAIEPVAPAPPTAADRATDGVSRTLGLTYQGFGTTHLEVLRDHFVAVAGAAEPGLVVSVWQGGELVVQVRTDRSGRFVVHRAHAPDGELEIGVGDPQATVVVDPERTVEVDLRR